MTTTSTPTTTGEQGCCKADSKKREDMCLARDTREKCEKSSSCVEWISGPDADCSLPETTTEKPGCCYIDPYQQYSKKYQATCTAMGTERECLKLDYCVFEPMNEYEDCSMLWPTTTTTTDAPGCCYGDSYKANDKCRGFDDDQYQCERKGCSFRETNHYDDCDITTTETPTTTVTPGCCKGTSRTSNDACNAIEDPEQCDRRSSCTFIAFGVVDIDCVFPPTEPPSEPGCCYGNPDIAYSARWMEQCKKFGTEEECLMLTNDDGEPRCYFEPLGEYEDCETVWPTTTETPNEPAGCCYGDSYKSNDKCRKMDEDRARCEKQGCTFLVTDDPDDCDVTTTSTETPPTTTEELGCCYGEGVKENEMCGNKVGRDQCERSGKCEFREGADADCEYVPTTTAMCADKVGRDQCERSGKCEFRTGYDADCELPTTTSEPWLGEKDEAVLFAANGESSVVSEALNTQVSLSTVLLLAVVAFAAQQLYKWYANKAARDGYTKLATTAAEANVRYQTA